MPGTETKAIDQYQQNMLTVAKSHVSGVTDPSEGTSLKDYLQDTIGYGQIEGDANMFVYNSKQLVVGMEKKDEEFYPKLDVSNGQSVP